MEMSNSEEMIQLHMVPPLFMGSVDDVCAFAALTDGNRVVTFPVYRNAIHLVRAFMPAENGGDPAGPEGLDARGGSLYKDAFALNLIAGPLGMVVEMDDDRIAPFIMHAKDQSIVLTPISLNMMLSLHVTCGIPVVCKKDQFDSCCVELEGDERKWTHKDRTTHYVKMVSEKLPKSDLDTSLPGALDAIFSKVGDAEESEEIGDGGDPVAMSEEPQSNDTRPSPA
jgi:hypothetical protein